MATLFNLKADRLGYSLFSKITRFVVEDVKPSHFTLQNEILCRRFTSEISENHHDFIVNYLINSCGLSPQGAISGHLQPKGPEGQMTKNSPKTVSN
ncbi:hypothetical protein ACFX11_040141 [Malus domestica]